MEGAAPCPRARGGAGAPIRGAGAQAILDRGRAPPARQPGRGAAAAHDAALRDARCGARGRHARRRRGRGGDEPAGRAGRGGGGHLRPAARASRRSTTPSGSTPRCASGWRRSSSERAVAWAVAFAEVDEIDRINIYWAGLVAMRRAIEALAPAAGAPADRRPQAARRRRCRSSAIVKGDAKSLSIAAASILAKTARDARMRAFDDQYPGYGFAQHKGYPVHAHFRALHAAGRLPDSSAVVRAGARGARAAAAAAMAGAVRASTPASSPPSRRRRRSRRAPKPR